MSTQPPLGLFVTGTDTEVGKTYVGALIARQLVAAGHRVGVYKPAASGCTDVDGALVSDDAVALGEAAQCADELDLVCPQRFKAPLAPHLAARQEGKQIDSEMLRTGLDAWTGRCDIVVVEGAGGLMSPLSDDDFVADLAFDIGYPLVVVAPNVLGTINQTLQTLIVAETFRDGLDVAGVVLNDVRRPSHENDDPSMPVNRDQLERLCVPPILAHVRWQADQFQTRLDWYNLAGRRRG